MKTVRFGFLALMVIAAACCYAENDRSTSRRDHEVISLRDAYGNRSLIHAIRTQIDPCELLEKRESSGFYYARVRCNDKMYVVYAVCKEWIDFFNQGKAHSPLVE